MQLKRMQPRQHQLPQARPQQMTTTRTRKRQQERRLLQQRAQQQRRRLGRMLQRFPLPPSAYPVVHSGLHPPWRLVVHSWLLSVCVWAGLAIFRPPLAKLQTSESEENKDDCFTKPF
jgi:hypothetical protein